MSSVFWLINADLTKCDLIPPQYHLIEPLIIYFPVCISMFTCYGRLIERRFRVQLETISTILDTLFPEKT